MSLNIHSETSRFSSFIAYLTSFLTLITFGLAMTAIPNSGANCQDNCVDYPYHAILNEFPGDYYWMVSAIVMMICWMILMVTIHHNTGESKRLFSQISLNFAMISTTLLVMNYYLQLRIIQASLELGQTDGISLLTQYNPNGIFIALEEISFLLMAFSLFFTGFIFNGDNRAEKSLKWVVWVLGVIALLVMLSSFILFGLTIEDRFEVIIITLDWFVLIYYGIIVGRLFRQSS